MLRETTAGTLGEYFERVKEIRRAWNPTGRADEEVWFRGQPRRAFSLLPGLYRPDAVAAGYLEETLIERFKVLGASHRGVPQLEREWEWYFLAQHYGLPTRLLDWTESALTALFFAVCEKIESIGPKAFLKGKCAPRDPPIYGSDSPTVWMLDAGTLNKTVFGDDSDMVLTVGGQRTQHYLSLSSTPTEFYWDGRRVSNQLPIAVLAARQSPRIVAQQGTFTVHGVDQTPIDGLPVDEVDGLRLACIKLDSANLCHMWDEIELTGISRMVLFPELENISRYLKWVCHTS